MVIIVKIEPERLLFLKSSLNKKNVSSKNQVYFVLRVNVTFITKLRLVNHVIASYILLLFAFYTACKSITTTYR